MKPFCVEFCFIGQKLHHQNAQWPHTVLQSSLSFIDSCDAFLIQILTLSFADKRQGDTFYARACEGNIFGEGAIGQCPPDSCFRAPACCESTSLDSPCNVLFYNSTFKDTATSTGYWGQRFSCTNRQITGPADNPFLGVKIPVSACCQQSTDVKDGSEILPCS